MAQKNTTQKEAFKFKLNVLLAELTPEMRGIALKKIREQQVSESTISRIRNCRLSDNYEPGANQLKIIADVLNVKVDSLYNY